MDHDADPAPGAADTFRVAGVIARRRDNVIELEGSEVEIDVEGAETVPPGRNRRFEPGEAVELHGVVVAMAFAEDGGVRAAPTASVRRVRALVIASGPDAAALLDEALARRYLGAPAPPAPRPDDPGSPSHRPPLGDWEITALYLAMTLGLLVQHSSAPTQAMLATALGFFASAVTARPARHVPPFRIGARHDGRETNLVAIASLVLPGLFITPAILALTMDPSSIDPMSIIEPVALVLVSLQLCCIAASDHRRHRAYRRLASPPAIDGVVEATAPELRITTAAGVIELPTVGLRWASTYVDDPERPSTELSNRVVVGGRVALVDHDRGLPIVLATSPYGDPRALAARLVWHRRVSLIALAALDAAAIALLLVP